MKTALPRDLEKPAHDRLEKFCLTLREKKLDLPGDGSFVTDLLTCFAISEFVSNIVLADPELILQMSHSGQLKQGFSTNDFVSEINRFVLPDFSETELSTALRQFRKKMMLRIAWRDLSGSANLQETTRELSAMADVTLSLSVKHLMRLLQIKSGAPVDSEGNASEFIVLALGKLGSHELNFSSDIDLIFCHGQTSPEFEKFFLKLSQMLINVLAKVTADGFVYRVDMRLRPYGSSGALICSTNAITSYYQSQGREWERFALAKARLVNQSVAGDKLIRMIKQFVYRRYIDFSIIDALREMKNLMRRESHGLEFNIKRGEGGIRELEFIVQVFQLIRGGKDPWFQSSRIFSMLPKLAEHQCLPANVVQELIDAHIFLRTTEHHLQEMRDQQTQTLPKTGFEQLQLAFSMGFNNWEDYLEQLTEHRKLVTRHFNDMISPVTDRDNITIVMNQDLYRLIDSGLTEKQAIETLVKLGSKQPDSTLRQIHDLVQTHNFQSMHKETKPKLALFLQQALPLGFETANPETTISRLMLLIEKIMRRSVYIILLLENSLAMVQLVELLSMSPWISNLLIQFPFLLDELIDKKTLYQPYSTIKLNDQLQQHMLSIPVDDLEAQMDCLRRFRQIQVLRVAASDAAGSLPLMKISDHLSNTASVIVNYAQRIAWRTLVVKHGYPVIDQDQLHYDDFAVIAYGKLGGLELGYGSDLDLVFLHTDTSAHDMTDGDQPITNLQFFSRLAQRIIHILSVNTSMGKLYEVDLRLRPSGASGLLVTGFESYSNYQLNSAWTWEHQALIRARMITGNKNLEERFTLLRQNVLCRKRDADQLLQEVSSMRKKMLEQRPAHAPELLDLNHDRGGIRDIEFMVQFLALLHAHSWPDIIFYTDNIRILEALMKHSILPENTVTTISAIYCGFREVIHRMTLQNEKPLVASEKYIDSGRTVTSLWQAIFGTV